MPSLFAAMHSAAESMRAFERSLSVVQNNVTNASTPGYARQIVDLVSLNYQPELNLTGGVKVSENLSSRSHFAEETVRLQTERYGHYSQLTSGLAQVEPIFDTSAGAGLNGAMSRLYSAFSQLSVTPNDTPSRENVISRAKDVANSFNVTAASLSRAAENNRIELRDTIEQINKIAEEIATLNKELGQDYRKQSDAGLDARLHASLEELSELVDFQALKQENGTMTVLIGGQTPLVIGDETYDLQTDLSGPTAEILDHSGKAVTSNITDGRLAGILDIGNNLLPTYRANLDELAFSFGNRVNTILSGGVDQNGQTPTVDLFANFGSAASISVTSITPAEIAAASATAPGGNGNALDLAALASSREINGSTFTEFYGQIGASVGRAISTARDDQHTQSLLVAQAKTLREELSGVNLDEEAASLIQYQRAYQAAAQMMTILNDLSGEVMSILR